MRIGVLGGSFDPPHIGHRALAGAACEALALDRLLLVPCARSPHKSDGPRLDGELRVRMLAAMSADDPRIEVSRVELDRPAPSYTADTLDQIAADNRGASLWLVIGADQLPAFPSWRDTDRILAVARLAVAARPGIDGEKFAAAVEAIGSEHIDRIPLDPVPASSSAIRDALAAGRDPGPMLPPAVSALLPRP